MKKLIIVLIIILAFINCYSQWERKSNGMGTNKTVWSMAVSGNKIFAGTNNGVYISTDNGDSWTLSFGGHPGNALLVNGSNIFIGSTFGVYLSTNEGVNWSATNLTTCSIWGFAVKDSLIIAADSYLGGVFITSNNGVNWNHFAVTSNNDYISSVAVSGNYIFAGDWAYPIVHVSTNNGQNWTPRQTGGTGTDVVLSLMVKDGILFAGADNTGIFKTTNNGLNWSRNYFSGIGINCFAKKDNYLFAGDFLQGEVFLTFNNGALWIPKGRVGNRLSVLSLTVSNQYIFAGTDSSVWRRNYPEIIQSFSVSGQVRYSDNNQFATDGYVKAIKLDKATGNIITYDSVQIQANGNYTLTNVPQDSVDIGVYPNSTTQNDWVMTYYPSTIYWQNATTIYPTGNLTNINVGVYRLTSSTNNNSVNGKVMRLNDNPSLANLKDAALYAKSGNTFVRCGISDVNGVYHLNSLPAGNLKIIADRMGFRGDSTNVTVTLTSNLDSVNFALYGIYVGIRKTGEKIPSDCRLFQNYPNPFNPISVIKYQLNEAKFVTLKVFDILGKEIALLVNTSQAAGTYEVTFDGSALPSGIYFCRMEAADRSGKKNVYSDTKKILLIK